VINNLPGGMFTASGEADFTQSSTAAHAFNNSGTFTKTGVGTATDFTGVPFNNSGVVDLTAGTLSFYGGGSNTTNIFAPTGTTLNLDGVFNHAAGSALGGAGTFNFVGGTHTFFGQFFASNIVNFSGGTITISNTLPGNSAQAVIATLNNATVNFHAPQTLSSLTFSSGNLQGSGNVTVSNTFNWSGGTMGAGARTVIAAGATANLTTTIVKGVNRTIDNSGTINYSGNSLLFGSGGLVGVINNLPGGVFTASGEADFLLSSGDANVVNNSGIFNKDGGGATTLSGVSFNNSNLVNVSSGTLDLSYSAPQTSQALGSAFPIRERCRYFRMPRCGWAREI